MKEKGADRDAKSANPKPKVFTFRCAFKTDMSENFEGELYVVEYRGRLFVSLEDDRDDKEYVAGEARLFVINAEAAERDGEGLLELLDLKAETAAYMPLIGKEAGNFSASVCKKLGEDMVFSRNMLILDRLTIRPKFRGQGLGLRYLRAAVTRFGIGCRIAVMKPFPLQFENKVTESNVEEFRTATSKLKKYYAREGFESLKGSDLMILDLEK
jgi:GNAT superfamily N-acetyltransferase